MEGSLYILNIVCVDGITIYDLISDNKSTLRHFLAEYDHEGSNVSLTRKDGDIFTEIPMYEGIYKELEG